MNGHAEHIVRVEGFELASDLPEPAGNALRTFSRRSTLLVRLTTQAGLFGWGETWAFPAAAGSFIRSVLTPVILGASILSPRKLHAEMMRLVVPDRRGLALTAVSAVDIAAWDAFGRAAGMPLSTLLGGALRSSLPAYASGPLLPAGADRYGGLEKALADYLAAGYRAVKIRVGIGLHEDISAIRRARAAIGPDLQLMADMNELSSVRDCLSLLRRVEDAELRWIEEPVRHDDLPAYQALAAQLTIPLAGGESFCGVQAFRDPLALRALDIVQPDLAICGGITEALKIQGLAEAHGAALIPHVWGGPANLLASMQFASMLPGSPGATGLPLLECDTSHNPIRDRVFAPRPDAKGDVAVPDGPGIGSAIDIDRISDLVVEHWVVE